MAHNGYPELWRYDKAEKDALRTRKFAVTHNLEIRSLVTGFGEVGRPPGSNRRKTQPRKQFSPAGCGWQRR
jgi:hypothetical protein